MAWSIKAMISFEQELISSRISLLGKAMRLCKNKDDAEDLVQDVMLKALKYREYYEPETNQKAWLHTILLRTFLNWNDRRKLQVKRAEESYDTQMISNWTGQATLRPAVDGEFAASKITDAEIRHAVDSLPKNFAVAVTVVELDGLTYKEAVVELGVPIGTAQSRVFRGKALLRQRFAA